jgi:LmbE family N-acetylglucosaminyl deacetylase
MMTRQSSRPSRRRFVAGSAALPALLAAAAVQGEAQEQTAARTAPARPLNIVCVGAHPDDPESGCGGTLARYTAAGHRVTVIYLTRGEAGIPGKSHEEAAKIRTAEAEAACKLHGAGPLFAGQIDGATEINRERTQALQKLVASEEPNVVFTHWPLDTHPDHQAASLLTVRAYLTSGRRFPVYFFEVNSGSQTLGFQPTVYVDITATRERKKAALLSHRSQDGESIYRKHHEVMETFRGRELGVAAAEAFVALARDSRSGRLPGL